MLCWRNRCNKYTPAAVRGCCYQYCDDIYYFLNIFKEESWLSEHHCPLTSAAGLSDQIHCLKMSSKYFNIANTHGRDLLTRPRPPSWPLAGFCETVQPCRRNRSRFITDHRNAATVRPVGGGNVLGMRRRRDAFALEALAKRVTPAADVSRASANLMTGN